jgi:hypothetical protein
MYKPYWRDSSVLTPIGFGRFIIYPIIQEMGETLSHHMPEYSLISEEEYYDRNHKIFYDSIPVQCVDIKFDTSEYSAILLIENLIYITYHFKSDFIKPTENHRTWYRNHAYGTRWFHIRDILDKTMTRTIAYHKPYATYDFDNEYPLTRDVQYSVECIEDLGWTTKKKAVKHFKGLGYNFQTSEEIRKMWRQVYERRKKDER